MEALRRFWTILCKDDRVVRRYREDPQNPFHERSFKAFVKEALFDTNPDQAAPALRNVTRDSLSKLFGRLDTFVKADTKIRQEMGTYLHSELELIEAFFEYWTYNRSEWVEKHAPPDPDYADLLLCIFKKQG